tara:strand:+ start:431 stop:544 length:114 start_codon:yes stop_codon:yes gene_type:complete
MKIINNRMIPKIFEFDILTVITILVVFMALVTFKEDE